VKQQLESLKPIEGADRRPRRRVGLRGELLLVMLPTATVLAVLGLVEALSEQRLLFASLASSAFLIYLDPQHGMNTVRSLVVSQLGGAAVGWVAFALFGPGYIGAGIAMIFTIALMIVADAMHPPAVATAMSFALRAGDTSNLVLFTLAVAITAGLTGLQRTAVWLVARLARR
jgi:CBS-domain-containing membrane protein